MFFINNLLLQLIIYFSICSSRKLMLLTICILKKNTFTRHDRSKQKRKEKHKIVSRNGWTLRNKRLGAIPLSRTLHSDSVLKL